MTTLSHLPGSLPRLPVRWPSVALLALAIAFADSFWLAVTQQVVGAIERTEPPISRWLRDGALLLPLMFLAVLLALLVARRWNMRHRLAEAAAIALLIALISGCFGLIAVAANSAYDYSFQRHHLELLHSLGANQLGAAAVAGFAPATQLPYQLYCNVRGLAAGSMVAQLEYATLMIHLRALGFAGALILSTNLVVAALSMAMGHDRRWPSGQVARLAQ
jgi:hypothetical protein